MQNQWFLLKEKFSSLSARERYIILFTGMFLIFMFFNTLYFDVVSQRKAQMNNTITQRKTSNQQLELAIAKAELNIANDPNIAVDKQIDQYKRKVSQVDNKLLSLTNELISPQKMRSALQDLLSLAPGVQIRTFVALKPKPLIDSSNRAGTESPSKEADQDKDKKDDQQAINLYRHGIKLTLKGDYFALRDYLKSIEQLPWAFYWQAFDYQVSEYPQAELNIEMYSLSTKEDFIGV